MLVLGETFFALDSRESYTINFNRERKLVHYQDKTVTNEIDQVMEIVKGL